MVPKNNENDVDKLFQNLQSLHNKLRSEGKSNWDRTMPMEELLFDRWEKADFLKAKKGASAYHNSFVYGKVSIGENTWIGPFTLLDGSGGKIRIGKNCNISSGVQIYTHDSVKRVLTGGKASLDNSPVSIGDCCYLGPYSIVTKGTKIGKCSVIGAHTLVKSDIPPNSIVFGVPGKVVGKTRIKGKKVIFDYIK